MVERRRYRHATVVMEDRTTTVFHSDQCAFGDCHRVPYLRIFFDLASYFIFISMRLLGKHTFAFANVGVKHLRKQHVSSSSSCTEIQPLTSSATMAEPNCQEPPDLSTWTTDQLIARVTRLEQQLKEQTAKCVHAGGPLETVLIA